MINKYFYINILLVIIVVLSPFDAIADCTISLRDVYLGKKIPIPFILTPIRKNDLPPLQSGENGQLVITSNKKTKYQDTLLKLGFVSKLHTKLYANELIQDGNPIPKVERDADLGYMINDLCKEAVNEYTVQSLEYGRKM